MEDVGASPTENREPGRAIAYPPFILITLETTETQKTPETHETALSMRDFSRQHLQDKVEWPRQFSGFTVFMGTGLSLAHMAQPPTSDLSTPCVGNIAYQYGGAIDRGIALAFISGIIPSLGKLIQHRPS